MIAYRTKQQRRNQRCAPSVVGRTMSARLRHECCKPAQKAILSGCNHRSFNFALAATVRNRASVATITLA